MPCSIPMYCKCKMPYNPDEFMIQYDHCSEWYVHKRQEHTNLQKDCITKLNSDESPPSGVFNSGEVSKEVCVIYDPRMLEHIQPVGCNNKENPEKPERIRHIYEQLEKDDLLQWCKTYECEEVKRKHLFAVHEKRVFRQRRYLF